MRTVDVKPVVEDMRFAIRYVFKIRQIRIEYLIHDFSIAKTDQLETGDLNQKVHLQLIDADGRIMTRGIIHEDRNKQ